jgi:hypothetical protein
MLGCESKTKTVEPQITKVTQEVFVPTQQEVEVVLEAQVEPQIQELSPVIESSQVSQAPQQREMSPLIIDTPPPQMREDVRYNTKPAYRAEVKTIKEETKLLSIKGNIPTSCQMWTDGCNTCTRVGKRKANCTTYKCQSNIKFSCLQWN